MSFNDKSDLFFYDYNIAPLFVQENYLKVKPKGGNLKILEKVAKTADSISLGDIVDRKIRSNQAWSLLPTMAVFSSVLPGEYMEGSFSAPANFPAWLGKNSNANKRKRLAQEIHDHTRITTSGSRMSVRLDYAQFLVKAIVRPLLEKGMDGVPEAIEVIKNYHLLREDLDSLFELTTWGNAKSPWDKVDSKVKASLTRTYNKEVQPYSFSVQADVKKKKNAAFEDEFGEMNEDGAGGGGNQSEDEEDEDSIEKSSMIKVKKSAASKAGTSKGGEGTSKKSSSSSKSQSKAKSSKK
jgi:replication factor C subunit 1